MDPAVLTLIVLGVAAFFFVTELIPLAVTAMGASIALGLLMALAVAANVGGTITMIGTPPNILMSATLSASGLQPFGFFEFAWIGIPLSIAGVIYMLTIGRRLCPHGHIDSNLSDLTSDLPKDTRKMAICAIILILVVVAMALSKTINVPMQTAAIIGALACVITGCLSEKQAYGGIDWTTIFLFAGMLPLAEAMDKTGAGAMIANGVVGIIGSNASPLIIVMALFLLSCGLTQFMSNTAAAALLAPIGISIAQSIGVSPFPVLMAIGIAASCAFTTPVATPPNTLILGPGKFHFMDYVKFGLPLVLVSMIVCTVIIPLVWPF